MSLNIDDLIVELEEVLQLLDARGESLAAIKLDEAIHILRSRQKQQPRKVVESRD